MKSQLLGYAGIKPLFFYYYYYYYYYYFARPRVAYLKTSNDSTSSCFAGNIRNFKIQRPDGNENVKKTKKQKRAKLKGFNKQNNNFARGSHIFCTFLCRFCTTTK